MKGQQPKPKAAKVDTVGLKRRLARDEREEDVNRVLAMLSAGKARDLRRQLGRSSVGETIAQEDADFYGDVSRAAGVSARARRDSLDDARAGRLRAEDADAKWGAMKRQAMRPAKGTPRKGLPKR